MFTSSFFIFVKKGIFLLVTDISFINVVEMYMLVLMWSNEALISCMLWLKLFILRSLFTLPSLHVFSCLSEWQ